MFVEVLKSKIHRVRVTDANLDYVGVKQVNKLVKQLKEEGRVLYCECWCDLNSLEYI